MTDRTIDLDGHRGMVAQKATDQRRMLAEVEANELNLRLQRDELEAQLLAEPAANWPEAAEKARYLLKLFAGTPAGEDPRRRRLIAAVLADFERLLSRTT
ncbi:MAG: hypothetical protein WAM77_03670 [Xanthobacteraceae bacterium]